MNLVSNVVEPKRVADVGDVVMKTEKVKKNFYLVSVSVAFSGRPYCLVDLRSGYVCHFAETLESLNSDFNFDAVYSAKHYRLELHNGWWDGL